MSEEILQALMQLFAIISKQDEGATDHHRHFVEQFLSAQLNHQRVQEYLKLYDEKAGLGAQDEDKEPKKKLTSVKDSVRTLAICRKINKTLTQKQKVVVLIRLFELLKTDNQYTEQRMGIINTVADVFNISKEELELISNFSRNDDSYRYDNEDVLIIDAPLNSEKRPIKKSKILHSDGIDAPISIIRVKSVDLYFVRYFGKSDIYLNGLIFNVNNIYLLAPGSTLRLLTGTIYYSDIISRFLSDENVAKISFHARHLSFRFPNGAIGLRDVNISEGSGLIGIMGASGAGKTTLLNVLSGIEKPHEGSVSINGIDIFNTPDEAEGIIGYISQDDLLMEDLTVFENLYYNAKLCFKNLSDEEIQSLVEKMLGSLGLLERKEVKVGSPLNKKISGGQRKRLNIALELIREPSVLFVDEPTSGLSSRDSENVMDLLKELSHKGKLIFVVIHQPSSDIYKMFDKMVIMDTGGYPIYYGNPIEAVMYFKRITSQINADVGECSLCGSVNPELLFNIIESKEIDDFGQYTNHRKKSPEEWNELYTKNFKLQQVKEVKEVPQRNFMIPSWLKQIGIFITRDVLSKVSNLQYMIINLLEAPLLAIILVFIIKYASNPAVGYVFRKNENIPPFIFMCIIVALFIGLTVSAEEIFRDRKILKRESFLNLSRSSYLISKIIILFTLSAIQTLTFVLIGNAVLGIKGLYWEYWLVLFSISAFANMLGLNISASFNSAVTIYILIPLLVIPQMILGGAMFSFDKLNSAIGGGKHRTPIIADIMTSRWAYEALSVTQFVENQYENKFYEIDKIESLSNYKQVFYIPELKSILRDSRKLIGNPSDSARKELTKNLTLLRNELSKETKVLKDIPFPYLDKITVGSFTVDVADEISGYLEKVNDKYITLFNAIDQRRNKIIRTLEEELGGESPLVTLKDDYANDFLAELVKKVTIPNKILRLRNHLVRIIDPVFLDPPETFVSFRAHFYAPVKYLFGKKVSTLYFNLAVIWFFSILLYITLYYNALSKLLSMGSKIRFSKLKAE